jgi:hypothetical protein
MQAFFNVGEHCLGVAQPVLRIGLNAGVKFVERIVHETEGHVHVGLDQLHADAFRCAMLMFVMHVVPSAPRQILYRI